MLVLSSTVNDILRDASHVKEHLNDVMMKLTVITKKHGGTVSEVEKLLTLRKEAYIQKHVV
jgi:hypothetical protein